LVKKDPTPEERKAVRDEIDKLLSSEKICPFCKGKIIADKRQEGFPLMHDNDVLVGFFFRCLGCGYVPIFSIKLGEED